LVFYSTSTQDRSICTIQYNIIQYNIRFLTIADRPQLSSKIYTIAIHTNIISICQSTRGDYWLRRLRIANEEHTKTYSCMNLHAIQ